MAWVRPAAGPHWRFKFATSAQLDAEVRDHAGTHLAPPPNAWLTIMDFGPPRRADADLRVYFQGTAEPPIICGTQAVGKSPSITLHGLRVTRRIGDQAVPECIRVMRSQLL